jgi:hypothetical protein
MRSLPQHRSVQGRRPSVGPTTARRRPSVRRRPGAGFLPAWRPAARVSASRERIRVYAEDEYFAHGGQMAEVARDGFDSAREDSVLSADVATAEEAHGLRMAAGALLIAGAGALGVVLTLGAFASSTHVRRKTALRVARANARTAGAASSIVAARGAYLHPSGARRVRPVTTPARRARRARRSASVRNRSNARLTNAAASRAAAGRALPGTDGTAGEPVFPDARGTTGGSHGPITGIAASSNSASHRGSGEFGFER